MGKIYWNNSGTVHIIGACCQSKAVRTDAAEAVYESEEEMVKACWPKVMWCKDCLKKRDELINQFVSTNK